MFTLVGDQLESAGGRGCDGRPADTLSSKHGPKVTLILGMVIIAIGYGAGLGLMSAPWQSLVITAILGVGIGLACSSLPALIVGAVPALETGLANGLNTLMRSIGSSVPSAVIGMILANTAHHTNGVTVPTMHGFRVSFLIATGAMAIGLITALFLPRARPPGWPQHRASGKEDVKREPVGKVPSGASAAGSWTLLTPRSPAPRSP